MAGGRVPTLGLLLVAAVLAGCAGGDPAPAADDRDGERWVAGVTILQYRHNSTLHLYAHPEGGLGNLTWEEARARVAAVDDLSVTVVHRDGTRERFDDLSPRDAPGVGFLVDVPTTGYVDVEPAFMLRFVNGTTVPASALAIGKSLTFPWSVTVHVTETTDEMGLRLTLAELPYGEDGIGRTPDEPSDHVPVNDEIVAAPRLIVHAAAPDGTERTFRNLTPTWDNGTEGLRVTLPEAGLRDLRLDYEIRLRDGTLVADERATTRFVPA